MIPEKSWFILNTFKQGKNEEFCIPAGYPKNRLDELYKRLLMIKAFPPVGGLKYCPTFGICANVDMWSFLTDEEILDMWSTWEHWSGDIDWPIRYTGIGEQGKWKGKTKQSKQRYELLDHCINHVQKLILQQKDTDEN